MTNRIPLSMRIIHLLPIEVAHNMAIWGIRTGLWRISVIFDNVLGFVWASWMFIWSTPALWMLNWCENYLDRHNKEIN